MDLIPHDWMIENTYLKLKLSKWKIPFKTLSLLPTLCKGTRKLKDFQKTSSKKEIYFILQSN